MLHAAFGMSAMVDYQNVTTPYEVGTQVWQRPGIGEAK